MRGMEGRAQLVLAHVLQLSSTFPSHISPPHHGSQAPGTLPFSPLSGVKWVSRTCSRSPPLCSQATRHSQAHTEQQQQGATGASTQPASAKGRLEGGRLHAGRAWGPRNPWENARTLRRKQMRVFSLAPRGTGLLTHHVVPSALIHFS